MDQSQDIPIMKETTYAAFDQDDPRHHSHHQRQEEGSTLSAQRRATEDVHLASTATCNHHHHPPPISLPPHLLTVPGVGVASPTTGIPLITPSYSAARFDDLVKSTCFLPWFGNFLDRCGLGPRLQRPIAFGLSVWLTVLSFVAPASDAMRRVEAVYNVTFAIQGVRITDSLGHRQNCDTNITYLGPLLDACHNKDRDYWVTLPSYAAWGTGVGIVSFGCCALLIALFVMLARRAQVQRNLLAFGILIVPDDGHGSEEHHCHHKHSHSPAAAHEGSAPPLTPRSAARRAFDAARHHGGLVLHHTRRTVSKLHRAYLQRAQQLVVLFLVCYALTITVIPLAATLTVRAEAKKIITCNLADVTAACPGMSMPTNTPTMPVTLLGYNSYVEIEARLWNFILSLFAVLWPMLLLLQSMKNAVNDAQHPYGGIIGNNPVHFVQRYGRSVLGLAVKPTSQSVTPTYSGGTATTPLVTADTLNSGGDDFLFLVGEGHLPELMPDRFTWASLHFLMFPAKHDEPTVAEWYEDIVESHKEHVAQLAHSSLLGSPSNLPAGSFDTTQASSGDVKKKI